MSTRLQLVKLLVAGNYSKADLALANQFPLVIQEAVSRGFINPAAKKEEPKKTEAKRVSKRGRK